LLVRHSEGDLRRGRVVPNLGRRARRRPEAVSAALFDQSALPECGEDRASVVAAEAAARLRAVLRALRVGEGARLLGRDAVRTVAADEIEDRLLAPGQAAASAGGGLNRVFNGDSFPRVRTSGGER
jgi:hypothetical protein